MKGLFDKNLFPVSSFSKKARNQSKVVSSLIILFFAISSFIFFYALYAFTEILGAFVSGSYDVALHDFIRILPIIVCFLMPFEALLLLHALFRNVSEEKRNKSLRKDAIILLCFSLFNIAYVPVGRIAGVYLSLVEGSPTYIYPLDTFLFSLLFLLIAIFALIYQRKIQIKHPYVVPSRGDIVTKRRGLYCTFHTFFLLFSLFGLSGSIHTIFIYDFVHEQTSYGISIILAYFLPALFLGFWEFYYNELREEAKKKVLLPLSVMGIILALTASTLYFVSLNSDMDSPSNAGFGMLPIAFAASLNIATTLEVLSPLAFAVVAFIKGIRIRKHKED